MIALRKKLRESNNINELLSSLNAKCKFFPQNLVKIYVFNLIVFIVEEDKKINRPSGAGIPPGKFSTQEASSGKCEPKLECLANPITKDFTSSSNNQVAYPHLY